MHVPTYSCVSTPSAGQCVVCRTAPPGALKSAHFPLAPSCVVPEMPPPRRELPGDAVLEFLSDVEGNWQYLQALVARSEILSWSSEDASLLQLADHGFFVFGGDAPDKGPGDIRVTKALVLLQRQHPDRVFLIAGNRDVNKLRLMAELASGEFPDQDPLPYLDDSSWQGKKQQFADYLAERKLERTRWTALQWLVEKTMGTATMLETRAAELKLLGRAHDEEAILQSFIDLIDPQGSEAWSLWYLRAAHIMLLIGDSVFVHGGITEEGLLLLPAEDCRDGVRETQPPPLRLPRSTGIDIWAAELNAWKARQLRLYEAFPYFQRSEGPQGQQHRWRGGVPLMMPSLSGCHVMTSGYLKGGNCAEIEDAVAAYLAENGIQRVFSGHQPHGQSPGVIRCTSKRVVVFVADTSFSDVKADKSCNPADCRGHAVSTVSVRSGSTTVSGVLADGTAHGFVLRTNWDDDEESASFVGRMFSDGSWGKTVVDGRIQTCKGEGFVLKLALLTCDEARAAMQPSFPGA
eukprot:TRINITY_DN104022_c0_g1_i1.p1 TRINITY_DN104022_c0_g1~~TRINITY_DN104022_c0_g1_i1.p1  ORF type:complete len:518 (-),score=78.16 TRINITY_DN104022_c0_g1_i1:52-1605(-)